MQESINSSTNVNEDLLLRQQKFPNYWFTQLQNSVEEKPKIQGDISLNLQQGTQLMHSRFM